MIRRAICLSILFVVAGNAKEPDGNKTTPGSEATRSTRSGQLSRRRELEKRLQQPFRIEPADRKTISLVDFAELVRRNHQVNIRIDEPWLNVLFSNIFGKDSQANPSVSYASPPSSTLTPIVEPSVKAPNPYGNENPPAPLAPKAAPVASLPQPTPPVVAKIPASKPGVASVESNPSSEPGEQGAWVRDNMLNKQIPVAKLALEGATIESALESILASVSVCLFEPELIVPTPITQAVDLDYVVQSESVLVTTKLRANLNKETRVYDVSKLKDCPPENLARVITHTVRPWSWRGQVQEFAGQISASFPKNIPFPTVQVSSLVSELSGGQVSITPVKGEGGAKNAVVPASGTTPKVETLGPNEIQAIGNFLTSGAATAIQASLSAAEMVHHGDLPTGVIETMPGRLVITQSQGAHREIAELLEQLAEPIEQPLTKPTPARK